MKTVVIVKLKHVYVKWAQCLQLFFSAATYPYSINLLCYRPISCRGLRMPVESMFSTTTK